MSDYRQHSREIQHSLGDGIIPRLRVAGTLRIRNRHWEMDSVHLRKATVRSHKFDV